MCWYLAVLPYVLVTAYYIKITHKKVGPERRESIQHRSLSIFDTKGLMRKTPKSLQCKTDTWMFQEVRIKG